MTRSQIKEYFDSVYNGQKNFMTRKIIDYRKKKNIIVEISEVKIPDKTFIGCTFLYVKKNNNGHIVAHKFPSKFNRLVRNKEEALFLLQKYSDDERLLEEI